VYEFVKSIHQRHAQAILNAFEGVGLPPHAKLTWQKIPTAHRLEPLLDPAKYLAPLRSKTMSIPCKNMDIVFLCVLLDEIDVFLLKRSRL
jgi:hypothetical protein